MHCSSCGFENPDGMNFCGKCAARLTPRCVQCGFENPSGFAFCGKCAAALSGKAKGKRQKAKGKSSPSNPQHLAPNTQPPIAYTPTHLAERILFEQAAMAARGVTDGERKTITALFADL